MPGKKVCKDGVPFEKVFADELAYVRERWKTIYPDPKGNIRPENRRSADNNVPTAANDLVGLAFSGGGIRSATINMGIAQALHERGVFDHVDYMSTVSGGGYLGSSISTAMRALPDDPAKHPPGKGEFPYALDFPRPPLPPGTAPSEEEKSSPFLTWVRNNSNYMAPGGFIDYLRIVGVLIRGILINFLVLVPLLLLFAVVLSWWHEGPLTTWDAARTAKVAEQRALEAEAASAEARKAAREGGAAAYEARAKEKEALARSEEARARADAARKRWASGGAAGEPVAPTIRSFFSLAPLALGVFVLLALIFSVMIRVYKVYKHGELVQTGQESDVSSRGQVEKAFAWTLFAIGAFAAIEVLPILIQYFHQLRDVGLRGAYASLASGGALTAIMASGKLVSKLGGLRQKLIVFGVGLLGLVIPLVVVFYAAEGLIYRSWGTILPFDPHLRDAMRGLTDEGLAPDALWLIPGSLLVVLGGGAGAALVGWLWKKKSKWRTAVSLVAILVGAAVAYLYLIEWLSLGLARISRAPAGAISPEAFVLGSAFVVFGYCWLSVEVNLTSVSGLYRDRLASAYLIGQRWDEKKEEEIFVEPDLNLEGVCVSVPPDPPPATPLPPDHVGTRSKAPYHIVNTALNLQGSKDPFLRDRNSDFFMFSKYYYGGSRTGFCKTDDLEKVYPQMDLPTAMAISAAAASPNSGRVTNKPLVAIMTLLNVRLGSWVPHPGRLCKWLAPKKKGFKPKLWHRFFWRIPPRSLLREMRSGVDEEHKWVNLSDGGHIENLALYELLRRRCRYIICGDGEADPELTFGGLATLMRYARIDMGIEIEILLDDVRLGADRTSNQHAALGRIKYPPLDPSKNPEEGYLLYIKSSFTGDEDETIQEYRAKSKDNLFPHESTADQFFDEGQFEAYRALGYHIADGLFPPRRSELPTFKSWRAFVSWFAKLKADLAPRLSAKHAGLKQQLHRIQELLQEPKYHGYFFELNPNLGEGAAARPAGEEQATLPEITYLANLQLALMESAFSSLNLDQPHNWEHEGNQGWRTLFESWAESDSFRTAYDFLHHLYSGRFQNFCARFLDLKAPDWEE